MTGFFRFAFLGTTNMPTFKIVSRWDTTRVIFECEADSLRAALEQAVVKEVCLRDSNLRGSDLSGSDLSGSDLRDSDFRDSNLRDSNFRGSDLRGSNFRGSDLRGSNFRDSNLRDSDLRDSDFSGSDLRGSDLRDSDFSDSNFRDSDLSGSDLSGSNFRGSDLRDSDFSVSDLRGSNLTPIRDDLWAVLSASPSEVDGLRAAIAEGRISGSSYEGDCACLVGTIAKVCHKKYDELPNLKPNSNRPAERFFLAIKVGDTPETNQFSRLPLELGEAWLWDVKSAFSVNA